ncbi:MAG TPA: SufD family Fe-S cluster assembly protein [Verrucomicrobiae bacterium]|nr:SufD family Fe-S cluster assembly protein [Verrucomicrobiae bacterium]
MAAIAMREKLADKASMASQGPAWLAPVREKAFSRFQSMGFPTRQWEAWKYMNLFPVLDAPFHQAQREAALESARTQKLSRDALQWVFSGGYYLSDLSSKPGSGLEAKPLMTALASETAPLAFFARDLDSEENPFVLINTFSFTEGLLLRVPKSWDNHQPLNLLFLDAGGAPSLAMPRVSIILEEGAKAQVVCRMLGGAGQGSVTNAVFEVFLEQGASLKLAQVILQDGPHYPFAAARFYLKAGSSAEQLVYCRGGKMTKLDTRVELEGEGATCRLNGLSILGGAAQAFHELTVNHRAPLTLSRQFYKNILDDEAQAEFNSLSYVFRDAVKSDTQQLNKNLLLSDDARVYSRPKLKIYTDDVSANHGSANGPTQERELFYLRSRGLDPKAARLMLAEGFAREVLDKADMPAAGGEIGRDLRRELQKMVD